MHACRRCMRHAFTGLRHALRVRKCTHVIQAMWVTGPRSSQARISLASDLEVVFCCSQSGPLTRMYACMGRGPQLYHTYTQHEWCDGGASPRPAAYLQPPPPMPPPLHAAGRAPACPNPNTRPHPRATPPTVWLLALCRLDPCGWSAYCCPPGASSSSRRPPLPAVRRAAQLPVAPLPGDGAVRA